MQGPQFHLDSARKFQPAAQPVIGLGKVLELVTADGGEEFQFAIAQLVQRGGIIGKGKLRPLPLHLQGGEIPLEDLIGSTERVVGFSWIPVGQSCWRSLEESQQRGAENRQARQKAVARGAGDFTERRRGFHSFPSRRSTSTYCSTSVWILSIFSTSPGSVFTVIEWMLLATE